jgi:hypothetical protein
MIDASRGGNGVVFATNAGGTPMSAVDVLALAARDR